MIPRRYSVLCLLVSGAIAGCGSNGGDGTNQPPLVSQQQQVAADSPPDGHYRGTAAIGGDHGYHVEALFTADGEVLLHLGGPGAEALGTGAGVPAAAFAPAEAASFIGTVSWTGAQGSGQGVVIGERCLASKPGRFCATPAAAELAVRRVGATLAGELRVRTARGAETWTLDISAWSLYYRTSASQGFRGSMFRERLAPFAEASGPIITVDSGGRWFFQSVASGCIGNGTLAPHADGRFYVFDVDLLIEQCNAEHAYLNGRFEGLATESQDNYWGYDNWLVMLLHTPEGAPSRVALTTLAEGL